MKKEKRYTHKAAGNHVPGKKTSPFHQQMLKHYKHSSKLQN